MHLNLDSGTDTVTVDAILDAEVLRGKFAAGADAGPVELRRTAGPKNAFVGAGLSLSKEQWRQDLAYLTAELPKCHANAFHFISRERFEAEVAELDGKLDRLNTDEIYAGMDRIANLIGDGHTYIKVPEDNANFPIDIERFGDEHRVVATTSGNEKALGTRVIKIQDMPIARLHELLLALTPADETQVLRDLRVLGFLTTGIFLHGMGIIPDRNVARYTLAGDNGQEFTIDIHAVAPGESSKISWIPAFKERPLFRQKPGDNFWYTYLPDSHTVSCSFRGYKGLGKQANWLFDLIQQQHPDKLVIDLRLNGGGDYFAAMSNSAHFRYQTNAILAGQQIGEKPNSYQEAREMKLPNHTGRCVTP